MKKVLPHLRTRLLACLIVTWPFIANAQASTATPIRTIPEESFQHWVREDNKLIKSILGSLTHIDALLADIERMIRQLPDTVTPPESSMPAPAPIVIEKTVIQEVSGAAGPLAGWPPTLAGAALLALLAFWLGKRQASVGATPTPIRYPEPRIPEPVAVPASDPPPPREPPPSFNRLTDPAVGESATPIKQNGVSQTDQALELAETLFSLGLGHGAAQTLVGKIRSEPKQALRHWLNLLEIYRINGQEEEFERSAEELRLHFNIDPEDWHALPDTLQSIEDIPHIANRLVELWGEPECLVYMKNLLDDNRRGARSSLPQSAAEELSILTTVMREAYGFLAD